MGVLVSGRGNVPLSTTTPITAVIIGSLYSPLLHFLQWVAPDAKSGFTYI